MRDNFIPTGQRARLFDIDGLLVADSYAVTEVNPGQPLPPARPAGTPVQDRPGAETRETPTVNAPAPPWPPRSNRPWTASPRPTCALGKRRPRRLVSIPVRHVQQVLGVLTLEAGDVDETLAAQRRALMPFALVALAVNLLGSLLMHLFVARPVMRLSAAADEVRLQRARAISLPDLEGRKDEIGDLARSLETMTETLSDRMDAIERFAADVSHEIKNPLTSIRSALETLPLVKTEAQREKLTALLQQDVRRLDRLITDISNASRLDAELSRDRPRTIDLTTLLTEIVGVYEARTEAGRAAHRLRRADGRPHLVMGRDGPLGQVFRNLIDNARSFSPPDGEVRVILSRDATDPDRPAQVRSTTTAPAFRPKTSRRSSSASTPRGPRARPSGPIPASACPSRARSSRRTAAASGPRTAPMRRAKSPAPASRSPCRCAAAAG